MLYTNYENRKRHQEVRYQIPSEIQWDVCCSQSHLI